MKKIIKTVLKILLIAFIFALLFIPAVYTNSLFGYLPALVFVLALLISAVLMIITRRNINISSDLASSVCQRGSSIAVGLNITNSGIIACPRADADIFISDIFGNSDTATRTSMTLAPKSRNSLSFDMDMPHIGVYDIGVSSMEIYDFFGIFRSSVEIGGKYQAFVIPRIFPVEELIDRDLIKEEAPKDRSTAVVGGTDYMGIREYSVGDAMKNIHWKLSSKNLGYMTKIFESSREMDFSVILDLTAEKADSKETLMDLYDCVVETALSLTEKIAETHTSYFLIYPDRNNSIKRITPKGRDDDINLIRDLQVMTENAPSEMPDAYTMLEEDSKNSSRTSNVLVVTSRITEDLIQELLKIKRQGRTPELYLAVPEGLTAREMDDIRGRLIQLDESNVFFNFVTARAAGGTQ